VLFLTLVAAGVAHWSPVVAAMFCTMSAHGVNFPVVQSGAVSPFPKQAGTAAGLMGALYMVVAFVVGSVVGATHDGTLYPLAIVSCVLGTLIFASARMFPATIVKTA
jgi:MFS transporter, DHA1 family, multidrug resistance protein